MKKKGFTLIELIAVLVIMAILALIVTPLVMSIIRKARVSADKRSIDAYGRSIELAVASYLLDTGKFPTDISQLTIEYSGNRVECSTTQLNPDSSVYLTGCRVAGRRVDYAYGENKIPIVYDEYSVGDEVSYNGVDYYVIKDSTEQEASVTLLKATPFTVEEINHYGGVGTDNNHVNMYSTRPGNSCYQESCNNIGYGSMAYYSSTTCGWSGSDGCITDYAQSEIKYVVDAWKIAEAPSATEARLIEYTDFENLGYEWVNLDTSGGVNMGWEKTDNVPSWVYIGTEYWTMTAVEDSSRYVWNVDSSGNLYKWTNVYDMNKFVRPVIVLPKSAISS